MGPRALVVGGTGPTGIWIVHGLLQRGWDVMILHRGPTSATRWPTRSSTSTAAEDALMDAWLAARSSVPTDGFDPEPKYGLAYSGPGGRPRSQKEWTP